MSSWWNSYPLPPPFLSLPLSSILPYSFFLESEGNLFPIPPPPLSSYISLFPFSFSLESKGNNITSSSGRDKIFGRCGGVSAFSSSLLFQIANYSMLFCLWPLPNFSFALPLPFISPCLYMYISFNLINHVIIYLSVNLSLPSLPSCLLYLHIFISISIELVLTYDDDSGPTFNPYRRSRWIPYN